MNFLLLNITGDNTGANKYAMIMQVAEDMIRRDYADYHGLHIGMSGRLFIRYQISENSPFTTRNSPANVQ